VCVCVCASDVHCVQHRPLCTHPKLLRAPTTAARPPPRTPARTLLHTQAGDDAAALVGSLPRTLRTLRWALGAGVSYKQLQAALDPQLDAEAYAVQLSRLHDFWAQVRQRACLRGCACVRVCGFLGGGGGGTQQRSCWHEAPQEQAAAAQAAAGRGNVQPPQRIAHACKHLVSTHTHTHIHTHMPTRTCHLNST
jgi:hypothetical protein